MIFLGLFHSKQPHYKRTVGIAYNAFFAQCSLALGRFFCKNVSFERFLESDLTATGHFEALLCA